MTIFAVYNNLFRNCKLTFGLKTFTNCSSSTTKKTTLNLNVVGV